MYRPKKDRAFYNSLTFMTYLHYWPTIKDQQNLCIYKTVSVIIRVLTSFIFVACVLHGYMSIKNGVSVDISEDFVGVTGFGNAMFLCILFQINAKRWSQLFNEITDTTQFGYPARMPQSVKKANFCALLYYVYCNVGCLVYGLASIFDTSRCERLNKEKGIHEICGTVSPLWWPGDEIDPMTKLFFIIWQAFSAFYYVPGGGILTFLPWEGSEIIQAKIDHLKELFKNVFDGDNRDQMAKRLKFCIRYHHHILKISENFNFAVKKLVGQLSFIGAIILTCIGTQMLKESSIGATLHFLGYVVSVTLICLAGQKMMDATYGIQDAVYDSKWHEADPKVAMDLKLILMRCQKPVYMDAVPFGVFNYNLLIIDLLQKSVSGPQN
ncbi:odorant receptor 47b-like isoform X2 [Cylas formicarius]|uniref:odorant receptor 47b-like isoform X2 n=1 Tax=Cylas formicarius TaxID=197179 RepID=UPI002958A071|nr:odorant receptor 47b-like isoform X2 [Cylas formicarius]XP_060534887.1 odorant receptor 47b-like isoform X2 [Cylas formicarius]